jgi:hypothetical protein
MGVSFALAVFDLGGELWVGFWFFVVVAVSVLVVSGVLVPCSKYSACR